MGLFKQSKEKYLEGLKFIENHERFSKNKKLIDTVKNRIRAVKKDLDEVDQATDTPELSAEMQDLIGNLFSFSKNKETAAIEGAVALAKFGQYEKAVAEFEKLVEEGTMPLLAAKNSLRCHLTLSSPEAAIAQFRRWASRDVFAKGDLKYLRDFLEDNLKKRGIKADLPQVDGTVPDRGKTEEKEEEKEEEVLEVSSVGVRLQEGPRKGEKVEMDVTFQTGNTISLIIPGGQKDLAVAFEPGMRLAEMQCYAPMGFFNSSGVVSGKVKIPSGPKRGDYTLDITIDGG
jgi:hypothetical protein